MTAVPAGLPEGPVLAIDGGLEEVARGGNRAVLEGDLLPAYVARRRWFGAKDEAISRVVLSRILPIPGAEDLVLTALSVTTQGGTATYALPLGLLWEDGPAPPAAADLAIARLRQGGRAGLLTDGFALAGLASAVIAALQAGRAVTTAEGVTLRFVGRPGLDIGPRAVPRWLSAEQSNSSMVLDERAVLKLLRKIQPGIHPDAEMVGHLTTHGFTGTPGILGEVWLEDGAERSLLMLLQRFVPNQGDGWAWVLDALTRLAGGDEAALAACTDLARTFGRRLAEMHAVLATPVEDEAFAPEPMTAAEAERLADRIGVQFERALGLLDDAALDDGARAQAAALRERRRDLTDRIRAVARGAEGRMRTRIHGDLHLGQILVTEGDVTIIDFEGEPARPLAERRGKDIPLRDVAGVLRSFDYAAAVGRRALPPEAARGPAPARFATFGASAARAFLAGYAGREGVGPDPLLDLFTLEKAAYEIAYEAANRPDWIGVPVSGLAEAARRLLTGTSA